MKIPAEMKCIFERKRIKKGTALPSLFPMVYKRMNERKLL